MLRWFSLACSLRQWWAADSQFRFSQLMPEPGCVVPGIFAGRGLALGYRLPSVGSVGWSGLSILLNAQRDVGLGMLCCPVGILDVMPVWISAQSDAVRFGFGCMAAGGSGTWGLQSCSSHCSSKNVSPKKSAAFQKPRSPHHTKDRDVKQSAKIRQDITATSAAKLNAKQQERSLLERFNHQESKYILEGSKNDQSKIKPKVQQPRSATFTIQNSRTCPNKQSSNRHHHTDAYRPYKDRAIHILRPKAIQMPYKTKGLTN
ncbi:hypothetical protein Nepgr_027214 [Nepenthes gracilis]|uniref:Uncharacterized protein n=1 Tax=Nepenthes gracilis TaxID=150966 RepID=A0AAD3TAZ5_NEPGR|nr:hypothetical protein Nepgr_027214 [Nepenthes gracilis]